MAQPQASISVRIDEKPAVANLKKLSAEFGRFGVASNQALELVSKAYAAVNAVVGESIQLALRQQKAEVGLLAALSNRTQAAGRVFQDLKAYNTLRQQQLGIDADELASLQATLAARGIATDKLREATDASIALSGITGGELASSTERITALFVGNTKALSSLGITGSTVEQVLAQLATGMARKQAEARTLSGAVAILTNDFDDLRKKLGRTITDSDSVTGAVSATSVLMRDLNAAIDDTKVRDMVDSVGGLTDAFIRVVGWSARVSAAIGGRLWDLSGLKHTVALWRELGQLVSPAPVELEEAITRAPNAGRFRVEMEDAYTAGPPVPQGFQRSDNQVDAATLDMRKAQRRELAAWREEQAKLLAEIEREEEDAWHMRNVNLQDILQAGAAWRLKHAQEAAAAEAAAVQAGVSAAVDEYQMNLDALQRVAEAKAQIENQMADATGDHMSQMIRNISDGSMGFLEALGSMIGGLMVQLGTMLVQLGTAAVLAATLGTIIPIFAPLTGGPVGIAAGLATIAGGVALIAAGSAIGAAASPGARASGAPTTANRGGGPVASRSPNTTSPAGFWSFGADQQPAGRVVHVHVGTMIGSDKRRLRRELTELLGGD